jgi:GDPmannose 4,6-dehydratase
MLAAPPPRALVIGHTGQDGTLLSASLEGRGYAVAGVSRSDVRGPSGDRLGLGTGPRHPATPGEAVARFEPDEIYYLAAFHSAAEERDGRGWTERYRLAHETHVDGLLHVLEAMARYRPDGRLFYAASSLIFSGEHGDVQDESTPFTPRGEYALTKAQGVWLCREARERHGLFASAGILYNHESHLRGDRFLSRKVIVSAIRIADGSDETLVLGDLGARADWGYAEDFVDAFQRIVRLDESADFIVATGEAHSVEEFVALVFDRFGLDWRDHVREDRSILQHASPVRIGDSGRLRRATGWQPSLPFPMLVRRLVDDTLHAAERSS